MWSITLAIRDYPRTWLYMSPDKYVPALFRNRKSWHIFIKLRTSKRLATIQLFSKISPQMIRQVQWYLPLMKPHNSGASLSKIAFQYHVQLFFWLQEYRAQRTCPKCLVILYSVFLKVFEIEYEYNTTVEKSCSRTMYSLIKTPPFFNCWLEKLL